MTSTRRVGAVAVLTVLGLFSGAAAAADLVPAHLDILAANIVELPPLDAGAVPTREVELAIQLAAAPACTTGTGYLVYGFLFDADQNPATGVSAPPFAPLGVDAQAVMSCDPATEQFRSPLGDVALTTDPMTGATTLALRTTVARLPSIALGWVAYAQAGSQFVRLPAAPEASFWAIIEKRIW